MSISSSSIRSIGLLAFIASTAVVAGAPEVRITEDKRPDNYRRLITGTCNNHTYEISVLIGRLPIITSVVGAKVDDRSLMHGLRTALAILPENSHAISDVFLDRCSKNRVRLQVDVVQAGQPPNIHHYFLWLGEDGSVQMISERRSN